MIGNVKDFLTLQDFTGVVIKDMIDLAVKMKQDKDAYRSALQYKKIGLIFSKSSTRTRVSFEMGIYELGGTSLFLGMNDIQLGRGEPLSDTAKVLSRYIDGIVIRTFKQSDVEELAHQGTISVINGLTDDYHPCQAVADFMTIYEYKKTCKDIKVAFIGDGNNVAASLGIAAAKLGAHFAIATPRHYELPDKVRDVILENAETGDSDVLFTNDPVEAVKDADVIYTDVWASMGQEGEAEKRLEAFRNYQVNEELAAYAKPDYIFLHCLPAHRGEEVSVEVIDGKNSAVFDQAENRLHAQKAIMYMLMRGE